MSLRVRVCADTSTRNVIVVVQSRGSMARVFWRVQARGMRRHGEGKAGHGVLLRLLALVDDPLAYERAAHLRSLERVGVLCVEVRLGVRYDVDDEALERWEGFFAAFFVN